MPDPSSTQTGDDLAAVLARGDVVVPGLHLDGDRPSVRLVGTGESCAAWLVEAGGAAVLFRFPRRPPEEMPATLADEFRALQSVPEGVGTRGIAMDDTPINPLGRPYLVTTFVQGDVVDGVAWTPGMPVSHVVQLARLHDATHRRPAVVDGVDGEPAGGTRDLAAEAAQGYAEWSVAVPTIAGASSAAGLLHPVLRYLRERQRAFQGVPAHGLVHGDAVATNVVFDDAGTARYIDGEWAHVGDVAQDLAHIGGEVHGGPWYVPMSAAEVAEATRRYVEARQVRRPVGAAFDALVARREAWEVCERFMSSLHFERVHRSAPQDQRYGSWVETIRSTLGSRVHGPEVRRTPPGTALGSRPRRRGRR